jgi:V8-like Glu-specific endopeptidase
MKMTFLALLLSAAATGQIRGTVTVGDAGVPQILGNKNEIYALDADQQRTFGKLLKLPVVVVLKNGTKTIDKIDFETVDSWKHEKPNLLGRQFDGLTTQMTSLEAVSAKWNKGEASDKEMLAQTSQMRELLALAAVKAKDSPAQIKALTNHYQSVVRSEKAIKKAIYGHSDVYPPQTYQDIFNQSRSVIGLARKGEGQVICSGVLIAADRVLTARHCFDDNLPSDLEVWKFDAPGSHDPFQIGDVFKGEPLSPGKAVLDYAVVTVKKNGGGKLPGDVYKTACLSSSRLRRDEPVYLMGHPLGSPMMVHDNAFVLFPFQATEAEYGDLLLSVKSEFAQLGESGAAQRADLQSFVDSYVLVPATAHDPSVYENFSRRYDQLPTIGVDSDTSHGNSGSPMFGRREHRVVGILFAGEDDLSVAYQPGWRAHEAVLPISTVIAQLDAKDKSWRKGVCFAP